MIKKITTYILWLWIFLIPWQTRLILRDPQFEGFAWEYGRISLYFGDIVFFILTILTIIILIKEKKRHKVYFVPFILLLSFILWAGATIAWADDKLISFYYFVRLAQILFVIAIVRILQPSFRLILSGLVLSGLVQAVFAIFQFSFQWIPACKWLGLSSQAAFELGPSVIETADARYLRAYGSLPHPNILAGFLSFALFGLIYLFSKKSLKNIWFWLGWALILEAIILSFSRSAWVGIALALIFLFFAFLKQKQILKKVIIIAAASALLFFINFFAAPDLFLQRFYSNARLETVSLQEREAQINESFEIIMKNPAGIGLANYTKWLQTKHESMPGFFYQPVHNQYLLIWAELGFVGIFLFIALIAGLIRAVSKPGFLDSRLYFAPFLACFIVICAFDHYFWTSYTGILLFALMGAVILAKNKQE